MWHFSSFQQHNALKHKKKTFRSWFFGLTCGLTAWVSTAQPTPPLNPNDFNGGQPPLPPIGTPVDPNLNRPPVEPPPDFPSERPPHNLAPCICGPLVGNYRAGQIEIWHVQAEGGPLELRLTTLTVNSVDPQTTIVDVYDRTNLINSVTVAYTGAEAAFNGIGWEKFADVALGTHPAGKSLRLEARNGGTPMTQTHYWLKLCGARWMAIDSPSFHCLEEDHAAWRFRVQAGEPLILDLDNVGIPGPATDINWRLIDPTGTIISRGVQPIVAGVEFNLPTPMAGLWTLEMKPVGGEHYLIDKKGGADRHIYLDWHTSQRGRKRVEIVLDTLPALGVPFDVELFRRRSFGAGFTNDLIAKQISTNGYADFKHLPNGFYDVVVTPKDPGILPVPAQLDLILCDQPVTNRFIFNRPPVGTPPDFPSERPPHNLAPCICGPLVGNYRAGQIEIWHVQAEGGPLELRLTTLTVNSVDPQTTIVDVYDRTNLINSVTVAYTGAEAAFNGIGWEKFADVALGTHPAGKSLRLEARNGGTPMTQTHYWLKLCGARWMAIDSPSFHCLEEDHAAWRFRVQAGEPLILDLDNVGIPGPATDINWRLIDPTGTIISRGVQPIVAGVEFNLPTPMAGLWTLEMKPVGGEHYLIDKKGGADRHIYLDWHTSQRGRKRVEIVLDTLPALGVPFDVELFRRRSFGAGFTNDLIAKQISTNGYADFKHLPNGFYDVVVTPKDPGILPVPAQLDLILCDQPVTNRFIFKGQKVEPEINRPPSLEAIAPKVVSEGATLALTVVGSDLDVPPQRLIYSLSTGPTGLTVSGSGALAWTPTEAQGPSVNTVRVKVSDGAASVTNTFTVTVTEVNVAPIFAVVTPKTVAQLALLSVSLSASDTDLPLQSLTYSLVSGEFPTGMTLTGTTLTWTPTEAQGPSTYSVAVKVSDGVASVTNRFTVEVKP